jgi:asparagine synthase (glutamine-hydrolysing)
MDFFTRELYFIFHETILPTLLRNYDRYSMASSVEIRMPFMDHRLVSFVMSLPYTSKFGGGYTKKLLRDAVSDIMPDEVTWRRTKIGFNSPIINWMQGELKEWFEDTVHESAFLECNLVKDARLVQKRTMRVTTGACNDFRMGEWLWKRISPYIWEKAVIKRTHTYKA